MISGELNFYKVPSCVKSTIQIHGRDYIFFSLRACFLWPVLVDASLAEIVRVPSIKGFKYFLIFRGILDSFMRLVIIKIVMGQLAEIFPRIKFNNTIMSSLGMRDIPNDNTIITQCAGDFATRPPILCSSMIRVHQRK